MIEPLVKSGQEWNFDLIEETFSHIERIATEQYKLDCYPNQLEIISSEQMLDAYCITPDHKLLTSDLYWREAGEIKEGDTILGFDEDGPHRKYQASLVTQTSRATEPVYAVTLSSGKVLKVTGEHKWLIREKRGDTSRLKWVTTLELRTPTNSKFQPSCVPKLMDVWEKRDNFSTGWLSGMFDGEGSIYGESVQGVTIAQNTGPTFNTLTESITSLGFNYYIASKPTTNSCYTIGIKGTSTDRLRFLGIVRPERLISKLSFDQIGMMKTPNYEIVEDVKLLGDMEIVKITTSTGTFVCDGYPMHNCSAGLPILYNHWSYGEAFIKQLEAYKRGYMGLAYEIVINANPCIAYLMEENTMLMQALVMAHACYGHNHFFKNNYLFKQWTDAEGIIDYLVFAKRYIRECEEKYGVDEVEAILDAAHSLQSYGVDKYKRPPKPSAAQEEKLKEERERYRQSQLNDLWRTIPRTKGEVDDGKEDEDKFPKEPHENILYFIEKHAPRLDQWKREIIRIVRMIAQYFYPQGQTKLMNEGCATYFHHKIIHSLYDEGILDEGAMIEFYASHTNVVFQPDFDRCGYSGINPYALGFAMMQDIERIAMNPTEEDKHWFGNQDWVGSGDYLGAIHSAIANYKDESFVKQYLSPKVMRDFKLFSVHDDEQDPKLLISGIHNERGYKTVRAALSQQYNVGYSTPDIQVTDVDRWGDRTLTLTHYMVNNRPLDSEEATDTLKYLAFLWGYNIRLQSVDDKGKIRAIFDLKEDDTLLDIFLTDT